MPRIHFCDESSNNADDERAGIATCSGSSEQWVALADAWTHQLQESKLAPGDFHATSADEKVRTSLAKIMHDIGIVTACCTVRPSDFEKGTKQADRGKYGGAYGFARYAQLLQINTAADTMLDYTPIEIYIDQGGLGGDWFIQLLDEIAQHDELRAKYRLVGHGTVDRRQDVRVHCADLISHELLTDRHKSLVLKLFGDRILVDDWTQDDVAEAFADFNKHREWVNKLKDNAKKQAKAEPKL